MASPPLRMWQQCSLLDDGDPDVVEGAAGTFIGQALGREDVDRSPLPFDPFAPPDAFADDLAWYGPVGNDDGEIGLAPFIGQGHGLPFCQSIAGCIIGMDEEVHDVAGRQLVPFIEGRIEDAHIRAVDESQGAVIFSQRHIVGQRLGQGFVADFDFP